MTKTRVVEVERAYFRKKMRIPSLYKSAQRNKSSQNLKLALLLSLKYGRVLHKKKCFFIFFCLRITKAKNYKLALTSSALTCTAIKSWSGTMCPWHRHDLCTSCLCARRDIASLWSPSYLLYPQEQNLEEWLNIDPWTETNGPIFQ